MDLTIIQKEKNMKRRLFLCAASGIACGLSFWYPHFSFLIWFSLAPFLRVVSNTDFKTGAQRAFAFGLFFYFTVIFWVGHVSKLGLIVLIIYTALFPVLFFTVARRFFNRPLAVVTIPAVWVLIEWLKEHIWCGFSWANLGYSQYTAGYIIQFADIFGVKYISFLIVMANIVILEWFSGKPYRVAKTGLIAALLILSVFYSQARLESLRPSGTIAVSAIQPNTAEEAKYHSESAGDVIKRMAALSAQTPSGNLLVFPEAAWPLLVSRDNYDVLKKFVKIVDRDMLMGAVEFSDSFHNRAMMIRKDGAITGVYDKIKLAPFGEYVPLRAFLSFIPVINSIGDMTPGKEAKTFAYNNELFSVLICFEDTFPVLTAYSAANSDFLVTITNDEWFRGEPEAGQHLAVTAFRAIENRISFIRAANTGISGAVTFRGEIEKLAPAGRETFVPGVFNYRLPLYRERSFYNRVPELFVALCALFLICVLCAGRLLKKNKAVKEAKV